MGYWDSVAKATHMNNLSSRLGAATGRGILRRVVNPTRKAAGRQPVPIVGSWTDPNKVRDLTNGAVKTTTAPKGSATKTRVMQVQRPLAARQQRVKKMAETELSSTGIVAAMRHLFDRASKLADEYLDFATTLAEHRVDPRVYTPFSEIEEHLRDVARASLSQVTVFRSVYAEEIEAASGKPKEKPNINFEE